MKNKRIRQRVAAMLSSVLVFGLMVSQMMPVYGAKETDAVSGLYAESYEDNTPGTYDDSYIYIDSTEKFMEMVIKCQYDAYSVGKTFILTSDISLKGVDFNGIPYFSGDFDGGGHTISDLNIECSGSNLGVFRYISPFGRVYNLNVKGAVSPQASASNLGGIAGTNYGVIYHCTFEGSIRGESNAGGIAGINKAYAQILDCTSNAQMTATECTGGIAGKNEGSIDGCINKGSVNIDEYQSTLDLGGVDIGTFNITQNVMNRSDMGGIAGYSTGVITGCTNEGIIGYEHTGYNVGGIAGSQKGTIADCINKGTVYGRKDTGGIVGQAQPYMETEYLSDLCQDTVDQVNELENTVNHISYTMSETSDSVSSSMSTLTGQYSSMVQTIADNMKIINNSIDIDTENTQQYVDNINGAMDAISGIDFDSGITKDDQIQKLQDNLSVITDNLSSLAGSIQVSEDDVSAAVDNLSSELSSQSKNMTDNINGMVETLDQGIRSVTDNMNKASNQMSQIVEGTKENIDYISSSDQIEDISSSDTMDLQGVIWNCTNYGEVSADLNVGGVAGCMNVEFDADPEADFDLTGTTNVTVRSTVNCVVVYCKNYGSVNAKKNAVGTVAGLQELGFLYRCEGYGEATASSGQYVGGIVGDSASSVEQCYSFANVSGDSFVGGITGTGYNITDCVSISSISSEGECIGNIAGDVNTEGLVTGNWFAQNAIGGIDNISYTEKAWPCSYEEIMAMEGIPEGFEGVTITFQAEGEVLDRITVAYGGAITEGSMPQIPEKEGCYARWPESFDRYRITKNEVLEAEYVNWTTSVSSVEKVSDRPMAIVAGEFYQDAALKLEILESEEFVGLNETPSYAFAWKLTGQTAKDYGELEMRLHLPEGSETAEVMVCQEGKWQKVKATTDGSYVVCTVPYGSELAVFPVKKSYTVYIIAAAVVAAAGIALLVLKKIKTNKSSHID